MAEVVDADAEVDSACPHRGEPDLGAEGVARDRGADPRGKQQIVSSNRFSTDMRRNFVQPGLTDAGMSEARCSSGTASRGSAHR